MLLSLNGLSIEMLWYSCTFSSLLTMLAPVIFLHEVKLRTFFSSVACQGVFGESEKVKWRGTWVVKTVIKRKISHPVKMCVPLSL